MVIVFPQIKIEFFDEFNSHAIFGPLQRLIDGSESTNKTNFNNTRQRITKLLNDAIVILIILAKEIPSSHWKDIATG